MKNIKPVALIGEINMLLNMSECYKAGSLACYAGMPLNTNPFNHRRGCINKLRGLAWERGFKYAETQAHGT